MAEAKKIEDVALQQKGDPAKPGPVVRAPLPHRARRRGTARGRQDQRPPPAGGLDRGPRQSAHRARDGQPHLAASLRQGPRADAERLRQAGQAADASRTARLARVEVHRGRLVGQGDAPAHHALAHLPTREPAQRRRHRARREQRVALLASRAGGSTPKPSATRCSRSAATSTARPPARIRSRRRRSGSSRSTIRSRPSTTQSAAAST